jgi:hypothetical protein
MFGAASTGLKRACVFGCLGLSHACGQTVVSVEGRTDPDSSNGGAQGVEPLLDAGASVDLSEGLLLHLPLDESEVGSVARDLSGNGHDSAPSDNPPQPSTDIPPVGFVNARSLAFDGTQVLDLGNPQTLNVEGAVTVSAWMRPLALDGFRNVVAHGYRRDPAEELALRIHNEHYQFLNWNSNDHGARAPVPAGDLDTWRHLVGVYDGRMYRLYRDGELIAAVEDSVAPTRVDAPWAVGGRSAVDPEELRAFQGNIDEVRVYARALSAAEVRALFRL